MAASLNAYLKDKLDRNQIINFCLLATERNVIICMRIDNHTNKEAEIAICPYIVIFCYLRRRNHALLTVESLIGAVH